LPAWRRKGRGYRGSIRDPSYYPIGNNGSL
jgi:hypothetical protein